MALNYQGRASARVGLILAATPKFFALGREYWNFAFWLLKVVENSISALIGWNVLIYIRVIEH